MPIFLIKEHPQGNVPLLFQYWVIARAFSLFIAETWREATEGERPEGGKLNEAFRIEWQ